MKKINRKIISFSIMLAMLMQIFLPLNVFAANTTYNLGFVVKDAVSDGTYIYASSSSSTSTSRIFRIDIASGSTTSVNFPNMKPESLYLKGGKLYAGLCDASQPHSYYWWEENQYGEIAIIDCANFTTAGTKVFPVNTDPYDIVVDKNDNLYVCSGSGQWTDLTSYKLDSGGNNLLTITTSGIRQFSTIEYSDTLNRIYTVDKDAPTRESLRMSAFSINSNGTFGEPSYPGGYSWKYHVDFITDPNFYIAPETNLIFNGAGYTMDIAASKDADMSKNLDFYVEFNDAAFSTEGGNKYVYLAARANNYIHKYQYDDYGNVNIIGSYPVASGKPSRVFLSGTTLLVIVNNASSSVLEKIPTNSIGAANAVERTSGDKKIDFGVYSSLQDKTYLINRSTKTISVYDHASDSITKTQQLPYRPCGIDLSQDQSTLLISNDNATKALTMLRTSDLSAVKQFDYSFAQNYDDYLGHRHAGDSNGKLFVVDGQWKPNLHVFNNANNTPIQIGAAVAIGDFVIDSTGQALYSWYQEGWGAGYAGSHLNKYRINTNGTLTSQQQTAEAYPDVMRDPINAPILLLEAKNLLISKKRVYNPSDLSLKSFRFPDNIRAASESGNFAVGDMGVYSLDNGKKLRPLNFSSSEVVVADKDNDLYFSKGNTFSKLKVTSLTVSSGNRTLSIGESQYLTVTGYYNDGTSMDITAKCAFSSNNSAAVSVDNSDIGEKGKVTANGPGSADITVSLEGVSRTISYNVEVRLFLDQLNVAGYPINFNQNITDYYIKLPAGAEIPVVTAAASGLNVTITPATAVPGVTTVKVSADDGSNPALSKIYSVHFEREPQAPVAGDNLPFEISGGYTTTGTKNYASVLVKNNPNYSGSPYQKDFYLVVLILDPNGKLISLNVTKNSWAASFDSDIQNTVLISLVDSFDYDSHPVQLAQPKMIEGTGTTFVKMGTSVAESGTYSVNTNKRTYAQDEPIIVSGTASPNEAFSIEVISENPDNKSVVAYIPVTAGNDGKYRETIALNTDWELDGTYTIRAGNGENADAKTVEVKVPLESIYINNKGMFASKKAADAPVQIGLTINPLGATPSAITYTSSDSKIATVSANGIVNFVKAGITTITVKADGKQDQFLLTVASVDGEMPPPPSSGDPGSGGIGGGVGGGVGGGAAGGASSGGTPEPVEVSMTAALSANGTATASMSQQQVDTMIKAIKAAQEETGKTPALEIYIDIPEDATGMATSFTQATFDSIIKNGIPEVTIKTPFADITLSEAALAAIDGAGSGNVNITAARVTTSENPETQSLIDGGRPVYDLSVTVGTTAVTSFGSGKVTISLPYSLQAGENPNAVVMYYIDAEGNLQIIANGRFNQETGRVTFTTNHFSLYMIGYHPIAFTDVSEKHWGRSAIESAAARNLVRGIGDGSYQPERNVTRAEFVQMITNILALPDAAADTPAYGDVPAGSWYYPAIMNAKSAGLLDKFSEENFSPNQPITRQEMAAILNAATLYEKISVTGRAVDLKTKFRDYAGIKADYQEDVQRVVKLGLMQGMGGDAFSPQGVTTRAQTATVLMNLLGIL